MRRFSTFLTILITSFVMALAGLVASPIASASENEPVRVSSRFAFGSPLLTNTHKSAIEKAVTTFGTDATFIVTAEAGKLPGVSDSEVQLLATKRGQVFKSYLVKLGVNKSSVTIKVKITRLGIVPKTKIVGSYVAPVATTATAVAAPALTCATGGTCKVGDAGPGGGIVYYVHTGNFSCGPTLAATCNVLEVAPSGWSGSGVADPTLVWAVSSPNLANADVDGFTGGGGGVAITNDSSAYNNAFGVGLGYKNSVAIVTQGNDTTTAAGAARAYAGGSKNDWYLPTTAELNLLCQWNHNVTQSVSTLCIASGATLNTGTGATGSGFVGDVYRSSSERSSGNAWTQDVFNGVQGSYGKGSAAYVRPVRAFAALTCATGGTCIVGDRGPGGGIVFYVSAANFTSAGSACGTACKYLEVAPATWQDTTAPIYTDVSNDLTYQWSNTNGFTGQNVTTASTEGIVANSADEKTNWQIGQGFNNTLIMEVTGATSAAKVAVLLYAGNSTAGQWFIPSMNELNELCKYARGQTTGGLTVPCDTTGTLKTGITNDLGGFVGYYWSSSEHSSGNAWVQGFTDAVQNAGSKSLSVYVRPIRAF